MTTGHSPAASGALVRRRTLGSIIACALFAATWPCGTAARDAFAPPGEYAPRAAQAPDLLERHAAPPSGNASPPERQTAELALRDALFLALERNPELAAFGKERFASEAAVMQAGAFPNPVLEFVGDNLRNERKSEAGDRTTAIQIGQLIELGGKRAARIQAAEASRDLANWDYEAKRIEIASLVGQRFVEVLAAQQRRMLAEQSVVLARQVSESVAKRVAAGKVSPVEETKARLAQAGAEVELEQARREGIAVRKALGALWADPNPRFEKAVGELDRAPSLPAYERLAERVRSNPELARWSSELARRQAGVDAEKARPVPDITITAGVTRFSQYDDRAYLVGISMPLPLFNRNQGAILEASHRLDKASDELRAAEGRILTELARTYERLAAIDREIATLRTVLLPGAQSAFDAATRGYELGRFGFLDVLDAQRTLFQTRTQNLRALTDYQRGVSEMERLIGGPLDASPNSSNRQ